MGIRYDKLWIMVKSTKIKRAILQKQLISPCKTGSRNSFILQA